MRNALGLDKDYVPGTSMKSIKKSDVVGAALAAPVVQKNEESLLNTLKSEMKEKSAKDKKKRKRKEESSSSSSSDSDSSDSSSDSSEDSSSSDDSSESSSDERSQSALLKERSQLLNKMYNGIGLQTARGSGTNGYVQANLSNLLLSRKRVEYNSEEDLRRAEAEINRAPNEEILQHQRKRVIEMKCVEFEMLMEEKGFDDDEILKKVSDYRKLLLSQLESGELNLDAELDSRDSHARAKAAVQNRDRMRNALGLDKDYVPGTSMKSIKKSDVVGAALAAPVAQKTEESLLNTLKSEMKEKSAKDKKKRKRKEESSSSSSSDSDSSDSSSDSSEDSSSSDDSSESSSDESVKHKKVSKRAAERKESVEQERHSHRDRRDRKDDDHARRDEKRSRREDDRGRKDDDRRRRDEDRRIQRRREDDRQAEKRRRSRSPSESGKRRRTKDSDDRRRRRRSSSSASREERSKKRERSRERSPSRKVKEEPPSPQSEEESRHKERRHSSEPEKESHSEYESDTDSHDSLKYKMKTDSMAFSDEQELIDQIRHDLRMEDDSGVCTRVIVPERRRAKYGGLPLKFRLATSSDDEEEPSNSGYCGYEIPPIEESLPTREIIESRLRSRTNENIEASGPQTVMENGINSSSLFVPRVIERDEDMTARQSLVSKYITENAASLNNPLLEYAKYEAIGEQPSKSVLILYADTDNPNGEISSIRISVQPTTKVGHVIGYCLYRYFTNFGVILGDCVDDFQLLMADESGEIELDLPPLDRGRAIGELGFTVLALASKKRMANGESRPTHRVVVYLPSSQQFVFELEHLDHTLEWLRDETLKRRMGGSEENHSLMPEMEYDLEDVNVFGKPLNLRQSIANTGCQEFVLVRKFSSRGDFHPRGTISRQRSVLTPISRSSNNPIFDFSLPASVAETSGVSSGDTSPAIFADENETILSFRVIRLHKMKKNWPATMCVLSLTWLPVQTKYVHPFEEQISLRQIAQYYEGRSWKTVQVEFESAEEASQTREHMTNLIKSLDSSAYQAYRHSSNGAKGPAEAAESLLMEMADELPAPSSSSSRSKFSTIKRLKKLRKSITTKWNE
ncbi:Cwf21 [Oesophagostomum dentatum]|uniref:Cwf21 n=1 Tax=Oesophagostomum dentatum TaxID=61180 RepID=A0A0B1TBY4_OESDE|nr:Cwf21 [Oesophagostomum dentatum]